MRAMLIALLSAFAAWMCLAAAHAQPVEVTDIVGRTVRLDQPATRIVLGEGRHLAVLGMIHPDPVSLVAGWRQDKPLDPATLAAYRSAFPAIDSIVSVGQGGRELSLENIIALDPDVVILTLYDAEDAGTKVVLDRLAEVGIPVVFIDFFSHPMRNTLPSMRILGGLLDRRQAVEAFARFYDERLARIRDRLERVGAARQDVFFHAHASGTSCCHTAGRGVFDDFITAAGGNNIARALLPGVSGEVSLEFLIGADPDFYVATGGAHMAATGGLVLGPGVDASGAAKSIAALHGGRGISELSAVREGRAFGVWHLFNDSPIHIALIELLAKRFHPDLFADLDPEATLEALFTQFSPLPLGGTFWTDGR